MPALLILGPIFGIAALAIIVAHAHKGSATPQTHDAEQFELDHGMPQDVVQQVLAALMHEREPTRLEALARELAAKYPIAASELRTKAASLRGSTSTAASPSLARGGASPAPDMGDAALILQAAMKAYAQETDPVELEGFAESIRAKYPTATVLLVGRARELRASQATSDTTSPTATTTSPPVMAAIHPSPAPTYVVQAGDTPTVIAEKLTQNGTRWPELVAANSGKPTTLDGSFASLRPGEMLNLPPSWGVATSHAHASALPKEAHP